jgi:RNA 3'-terminal phosphate cyclase (ATP)
LSGQIQWRAMSGFTCDHVNQPNDARERKSASEGMHRPEGPECRIVDGSQLEGGGQLVRICLALCSIFQYPVEILNVRAGRAKPGLSAQHLSGCNLVKTISNGTMVGNRIGSIELRFFPGDLLKRGSSNNGRTEKYHEDCGTAGSITLMIQVALPCFLRCVLPVPGTPNSEVDTIVLELVGGTNVSTSPPIDHFHFVLMPLLLLMGIVCDLQVQCRGFYPRGGGKVKLLVSKHPSLGEARSWLKPLQLIEQGDMTSVQGIIFGNAHDTHLTELRDQLAASLSSKYGVPVDISVAECGSREKAFAANIKSKSVVALGAQLWAVTTSGCRLSTNRTVQSQRKVAFSEVCSAFTMTEVDLVFSTSFCW